MTLPCGCDRISPGTVKMCRLHENAQELLEAADSLMNCHTGAPWQTREIRSKAFQALNEAIAKIEGGSDET